MTSSKKTIKPRIALVLQGGGALGAYQAGIFQALHEHDLAPNWIVGTSIGAINAALIAGNKPDDRMARLKEFWDRMSRKDAVDMNKVPDQIRKRNIWLSTIDAVIRGVPGFYSPRLMNPFAMGLAVAPDKASFYDTTALAATLDELVDFEYLNGPEGMRLTVNAVKVTCGELVSFDNVGQDIDVKHIMASGALPPGFPPVRINDELYWDGGMYSNTPLETVLEDEPRVDTLCFMIDLWSAKGPEPTTLDEVQTRQKDVMFASRSQGHIDDFLRLHHLRHALHKVREQLPAKRRNTIEDQEMEALGCDTTMHIVRLPYSGQDWHMASKDINFSKGSIEWRWNLGYDDASRAIEQAGWLMAIPAHSGVVVHELTQDTKLLKEKQ